MKTNLSLFLFISILVVLFHYLVALKYLDYGLHSDDWNHLVKYKTLVKEDFISKMRIIWRDPDSGPHTTSQILYIGVLEQLFGLNYQIFNLINILSKVLATLSVYPLVLLVFKRKLLAFLTTFFYAISYSTVGTFHVIVKGTEYQAFFFMNIFLIIYYLLTKKQTLSIKWILALIFFFLTAIVLTPPRLFPLTLLPLLIEFFLLIHKGANYNLKFGLKKLFFLYLPLILLFIYHPDAATNAFIVPIINLQKIAEGNWFLFLTPFSALGYMILWGSQWAKLIGNISMNNFGNYLPLLFHNLFVFGIISAILALILSKNKIRFIFLAVVLNFLLEILIFFLATHHLKIPVENRLSLDPTTLYSIFVGIFVVVFSISCYKEWLATDKKNRLLLALWIGPSIALFFIFSIWLFANALAGYGPTHEYLTGPAIGISLMTASLLVSLYDKLRSTQDARFRNALAFCAILLIIIPLYSIHKSRADEYLSGLVRIGGGSQQQKIQAQIRKHLKNPTTKEDKLFFFDWTNDKVNADFYSEAIYSSFTTWIHYYYGQIIDGCTFQFFDKTILINSFTERGGNKGFLLPGFCVDMSIGSKFYKPEVFYDLNNFYAFQVINNDVIDIKSKILNEVGLNYLSNP